MTRDDEARTGLAEENTEIVQANCQFMEGRRWLKAW